MPNILIQLTNRNHKGIVVDVVGFEELGIHFYLVFEDLFELTWEIYWFFALEPVVILELFALFTTSAI